MKKRKLLCVWVASVASCDAAVAQCYLAENDWEMEVSFFAASLLPALHFGDAGVRPIPVSLFCDAELLLRAGVESASKAVPSTPLSPSPGERRAGDHVRAKAVGYQVAVWHPGPAIESGGASEVAGEGGLV